MTFTDMAGYRKAYAAVRGDVLEAHGYDRDAKGIRLASGLVVMDVQYGGQWMTYTDNMADAQDRVRMNRHASEPATFRLRTWFVRPAALNLRLNGS